MFINYTKKFVFLRVTKNASTSLLNCLIDNIDPNDKVGHAKVEANDSYSVEKLNLETDSLHLNINEIIKEGILKPDEIHEYNFYGVLRNPIDRFISCAYHILRYKNLPVKEAANGYWFISINVYHDYWSVNHPDGNDDDKFRLQNGLIHRNEKDAREHMQALLTLQGAKE